MTSWRKWPESRVSEDVFQHLVCAKQAFPRLVGEEGLPDGGNLGRAARVSLEFLQRQ